MNIYKRAWELFRERVNRKTSWGKNEIQSMMAACLEQAVAEHEAVCDGGK